MDQIQRLENIRKELIENLNPMLTMPLCLMEFKEGQLDVPYNYDGKTFLFDLKQFKLKDSQWIKDHLTINTFVMAFGVTFQKSYAKKSISKYDVEELGITNLDVDISFNEENLPSVAKLLNNNITELKPWIKILILKQSAEAMEGIVYYNRFARNQQYERTVVYRDSKFYAVLKSGKWVLTSVANAKVKDLLDSHKLLNKLSS